MRARGSVDDSLDYEFEWDDDDDFDARAADDDNDDEEGDFSDDELPDADAAAANAGVDLVADLNSVVARARSHRDRFLTDQINRWVRKVSAQCFEFE